MKFHKINGERYSSEHIIENHTIGPEIKEKYIPPTCASNLPSSHKKIERNLASVHKLYIKNK